MCYILSLNTCFSPQHTQFLIKHTCIVLSSVFNDEYNNVDILNSKPWEVGSF